MITVIAAVSENGVVGYKNTIPWPKEKIPRDLPHFMRQTINGALIMGKETFLSMGILPKRIMIVVSKTLGETSGIITVPTYKEAVERALDERGAGSFPISAIGGTRLWQEALEHPQTGRALITRVHDAFEGDTFFPEESLYNNFSLFYKDSWKEKDEGMLSSTLQIWKRK
jgi:dihydrofolate reductase